MNVNFEACSLELAYNIYDSEVSLDFPKFKHTIHP